MKWAMGFFVFLSLSTGYAEPNILGEWRLVQMIYRGKPIPLINPDLYLSWTFFKNGTERLYWDRGTPEFCERFAQFSIENGKLQEKTFALNPQNAQDCAQDPDMQIDRAAVTAIQFLDNTIQLQVPMGDEELIYVLRQISSAAP
jgi:hypothetical protein